jgi:alpha-N-arabinofuranosidase
MQTSTLVLEPSFAVAPVNRRIFGAFVEHMGRCVYTGIYEPGHSSADDNGFRTDVLDLVRELGVTVVRYPGGNFVSGFRWEDSVGPTSERPVRLDAAWRSIETNEFGLNEFIRWCRKADIEPMMAINLGTRGAQEAIDLWEYCNHPGGTEWSDLRRKHGVDEPHNIRMWCLGNEMDGPWQLGHKSADDYGIVAANTARALHQFDDTLELVACGSSSRLMPTFGAWEATVLEHTYDEVDLISAHVYYENTGDLASFLASTTNLEDFISDVVAAADYSRAKNGKTKRINISVDEWNVWYQSELKNDVGTEWRVAPPISEQPYTVADAVVVGSMLISLLRHSDRVAAACMAQLVNTIAPIHSEPGGPAWRQTIFHPFALTARHARGEVLRVEPHTPTYHTTQYGEVPVIDAVATRDPASGEVTVFVVNRNPCEAVDLRLSIAALGAVEVVGAVTLTDPDPLAINSQAEPDRVMPATLDASVVEGDVTLELAPISWTCLRLGPPSSTQP